MKQNESINILFLLFCILLLGFVYLNTRMSSGFQKERSENKKVHVMQPEEGSPGYSH